VGKKSGGQPERGITYHPERLVGQASSQEIPGHHLHAVLEVMHSRGLDESPGPDRVRFECDHSRSRGSNRKRDCSGACAWFDNELTWQDRDGGNQPRYCLRVSKEVLPE
jgi:hypothetical protein